MRSLLPAGKRWDHVPMTKLEPAANHYGRDVSSRIGSAGPGLFEQYPLLAKLWEDAKELLAVRSNDAHTLYSVSLAHQLLGHHPQADANIVLPAMLLHDIGWSAVDPALMLGAIAPGAGNAEGGLGPDHRLGEGLCRDPASGYLHGTQDRPARSPGCRPPGHVCRPGLAVDCPRGTGRVLLEEHGIAEGA